MKTITQLLETHVPNPPQTAEEMIEAIEKVIRAEPESWTTRDFGRDPEGRIDPDDPYGALDDRACSLCMAGFLIRMDVGMDPEESQRAHEALAHAPGRILPGSIITMNDKLESAEQALEWLQQARNRLRESDSKE